MILRAYKEFEDIVGNIRTVKGSKTQQIVELINRKIIPFSISDLERELPGISRDMIHLVLRQLRDEKKISSIGKGRGAKWFVNK